MRTAPFKDPSSFEIRDPDLGGRTGMLTVCGKKVETPQLLPVVNPNKLKDEGAVLPRELMEDFGFPMIITNSYIIGRNEGLREEALKKGLHRMLDYDGAIMTDSGTFQSYVYGGKGDGEVEVDPLEIVRFQSAIGADVGTVLDRFTVPGTPWEKAKEELEITLERAKASVPIKGDMELAVPVQGGRHLDLRTGSGRMVRELGIGYAPIGGVVPLMETYDYSLLVDVIAASKAGLGPSVPAHLFGAGHPMMLPLAVALGCDLFDSASYAKFASDDRYITPSRTWSLNEMKELPCSCPVCSRRSVEDLKGMDQPLRYSLLSRHNLHVLRGSMNEIRTALHEGTLWELVERSAFYNPAMYSAVRRLRAHGDLLEEGAPRSTRRFMCCSGLSLSRPEFKRYRDAFKASYPVPEGKLTLALTDWTSLRSRNVERSMGQGCPSDVWPVVMSPLGILPYDIIDMYPLSQSVLPPPGSLDHEMEAWMEEAVKDLYGARAGEVLMWDGSSDPIPGRAPPDPELYNALKVSHMLMMQFGPCGGTGPEAMLFGDVSDPVALSKALVIRTSRKTGKIRTVHLKVLEGQPVHVLSLRAEDGLMNLRWEGAKRLHSGSGPPYWRVVVDSDSGEFNAKGYNVFNKFVQSADSRIRAGDEVLVVDEEDKLLAVGKAQVQYRAMVEGRAGVAVKVREGRESASRNDEG